MIYYSSIKSPVGAIFFALRNNYICLLSLGRNADEDFHRYLSRVYDDEPVKLSTSKLQHMINQLNEYFAGVRTEFDIPVKPEGTDFQQQVWQALLDLPYGRVISYGDLAVKLNNPGGMRAVGAANGKNPIPILIPCHRVIAADGSLGGYTGGLDIKRKILDIEQQQFTPTLF